MERFSTGQVLSTGLRMFARVGVRLLPLVVLAFAPLLLLPWVMLPFAMLIELPLAAIVAHAVVHQLRGAPGGIAASIAAGLRRTPHVFAVMLLVYMVAAAVFLALGMPIGIFNSDAPREVRWVYFGAISAIITVLYSRWFVVIPAAVIERPGIRGALSRSGELTEGRRLRLAAVVLTIGVVFWGPVLAITYWGRDSSGWPTVAYLCLYAFFGLLRAAMSAAAYHIIRTETEAQSPEHLAKIFD